MFRLSRDAARERSGKDVSVAAAAESLPTGAGRDRAERESVPGAKSPRSPALRGFDLFSEPDEFWRGVDGERRDPFSDFRQMRERMNRLFDDSFARLSLDPERFEKEAALSHSRPI